MGMLSDEGKGLAKRFAMEKLRSAQGEHDNLLKLRSAQGDYESHLDKMIAPTQKEGFGGALANIGLNVKSFLGDKDAANALKKVAAKKSLLKGGAGDIAMSIGGAKVTEALGGEDSALGGAASGAMTGFKMGGGVPGAIVGAVAGGVMGLMGASEKRAAAKAKAKAAGLQAKAGAEQAKAKAQASMSQSISRALLGGKQSVRL
jgi:hypothetical protein